MLWYLLGTWWHIIVSYKVIFIHYSLRRCILCLELYYPCMCKKDFDLWSWSINIQVSYLFTTRGTFIWEHLRRSTFTAEFKMFSLSFFFFVFIKFEESESGHGISTLAMFKKLICSLRKVFLYVQEFFLVRTKC